MLEACSSSKTLENDIWAIERKKPHPLLSEGLCRFACAACVLLVVDAALSINGQFKYVSIPASDAPQNNLPVSLALSVVKRPVAVDMYASSSMRIRRVEKPVTATHGKFSTQIQTFISSSRCAYAVWHSTLQ